MLTPLAVHPQGDHALEVAITDNTSEPGLLGAMLVFLAIVVGKPILLLVKEVNRIGLNEVGVITGWLL